MPLIICGRCGRTTNTALCDWVDAIEEGALDLHSLKATRCYAAWDEDKDGWVEGCAMNDADADEFSKQFAKGRIK